MKKNGPKHGLIIVDTCFLTPMAEKIDQEYCVSREDNKSKCWADGLALLSKHGFSVRIPEMVAFEASRMLASGDDVRKIFKDKNDVAKRKSELFYEAQRNVGSFLHDIIQKSFGDDADISIECPDGWDRSPAADHMRGIKKLFRSVGKQLLNVDLNGGKEASFVKADIQALSSLLNKDNVSIKDFGDQASKDMMSHLPKNWSKPVFYFTSDNNAFAAAKKARPDLIICQVNSVAYLEALHNNGLLNRGCSRLGY